MPYGPSSSSHGLPRLAWHSRLAVDVTIADAAACVLGCVEAWGGCQDLNITKPVVPVLFVVALTILRYSVPKHSSGRE